MTVDTGETLATKPVPSSILAEVGALMETVEKEENLLCLVVYNPNAIGFGVEYDFQLIVLPPHGANDREAFEEHACAVARRLGDEQWAARRRWALSCSVLDWSRVPAWFDRFQDKPERFPLADGANGSLFISPVIHGAEVALRLRELARARFGKHILRAWVLSTAQRLEERKKKWDAIVAAEKARMLERRQLLNRLEMRELRQLVEAIQKEVTSDAVDYVVALDGSGRPIGKVLEVYLSPRVPIDYLDPRQLRRLNYAAWGEADKAASTLRREFPELHRRLVSTPEKVLFVDDQTGYGSTARALGQLVERVSGRSDLQLKYATMSPFMGDNTPSWLRKRNLQGIELQEDFFTLKALEAPTAESRKFYGRLRGIARSWKT